MNITQIESNVQQLIQNSQPATFIYDLLLAYGQPKASIKRLQIGSLNLAKQEGEIAWKKKLFYKEVSPGEDVPTRLAELQADATATKHDPRFIVVTDHTTLAAYDRKMQETISCSLADLPKHFDFFLPWAGMEKTQYKNENPADVKAAERMARLYDEIRKDNPTDTPEAVHGLNVFLSRLLFCFFAEDTDIFTKGQFTNALASHTQADGSDVHGYLERLFEVLNTAERSADLSTYLRAFPYVNGGLFRDYHPVPVFTRRSRQAVIDSGELDWSAINPDIFGSMIQAVITPEHRGGLGMHYTSVPNIMKVIEPLFLNELYETFEAVKSNPRKLNELLARLSRIKIFDPACGSGNFLIIAYKELRKLEIAIIRHLQELQQAAAGFAPHIEQLSLIPKSQLSLAASFQVELFSRIQLSQLYGIELDDFAHEVAILSLWLAEHQMNQAFFREFGRSKPALPLTSAGRIMQGNACRLDWEKACPKQEGDEVYILGNPPYLGSYLQNKEQKEDLAIVCKSLKSYKDLDYIACWFLRAADYIENNNAKFAFVTTNSICQGEQVSLLWPSILNKKLEIFFAHQSFKWINNAKNNAGVYCTIIGVSNSNAVTRKKIFSTNLVQEVENINPYLSSGSSVFISKRMKSISIIPTMSYGSKIVDNGNLIFSTEEKDELLADYQDAKKLFKKLLGSAEFIRGLERWCLYINDENLDLAYSIAPISKRLEQVKEFRAKSTESSTREMANYPHRFYYSVHSDLDSIIIPRHSSERRDYIPMGFLNGNTIISDAASAIFNAELWNLSVLTSRIHMTWVRAIAGRLKTDYRYSSQLCYNTFPFPPISESQKQELEKNVYNILAEREVHSEKTLAQLYDPDKMPAGLREAHHQNDLAVERCYRSRPFESDEERLEYLFKLYEQMIAREQEKGTLFEGSGKKKKK